MKQDFSYGPILSKVKKHLAKGYAVGGVVTAEEEGRRRGVESRGLIKRPNVMDSPEPRRDFLSSFLEGQDQKFKKMKEIKLAGGPLGLMTGYYEAEDDENFYSQTGDHLGGVQPKIRPNHGGNGPITLGSLFSWGSGETKTPSFFKDPEYDAQLSRMENKYPGFNKKELARIIFLESSNDPTELNPKSKAAGHFQFMPNVASELGTNTNNIINSTPLDQLKLYEKYLDKWNYDGSVPLSIYQAAPSKAKDFKSKPMNTVVYKVGTSMYRDNKQWRSR